MKETTHQLFNDAIKLQFLIKKQNCLDCFLISQYLNQKHELLMKQTTQIERLIMENPKLQMNSEIINAKQSLAVTGLYLNV